MQLCLNVIHYTLVSESRSKRVHNAYGFFGSAILSAKMQPRSMARPLFEFTLELVGDCGR